MIDERFFEKTSYITFGKICKLLEIDLPETGAVTKRIANIARLDEATDADITFFHNDKYADDLSKTQAYACVVSPKNAHLVPENTIALVVNEPYYAHAILLKAFYSIKGVPEGGYISPKASVSKKVQIEEDCYISDYVTISDGAIIRKGTYIGSNVTILNGVEIGANSQIEPNVTIGFAIIGKNAYIKTGARIGQQGFGFHVGKAGVTDVLQIGKVVIGDDVQIGANCTIDRGSLGDTVIGSHSRIDDLVHIAHNVEIGEYCIFAAQTGIAGSTTIGNRCVLGGQVGVAGHLTIGDNVTIAAQSGVMRDVASGAKIAGSPATTVLNWHKQTIALSQLVRRGTSTKPKGIFAKMRWLMGK